jgi:anaerobic ribonucleoside-triphosphate reductase activating protein
MKITPSDVLNGDGLRVVLWVAGCGHYCKGCHNPESWNPNNGKDFTEKDKEYIFKLLEDDFIKGITFSGGDPFYIDNREDTKKLAKEIKEKFPNKDIWLWTGYTLNQILKIDETLLENIDILIDGRYECDLPHTKRYRGSDNQLRYKIENGKYTLLD